ncbi:MAG: DUF2950 domain-containing protein [Deltaproteobacteria bacterium]|nr:DUF2950 domain-containing protein [Deltaproteobacteria bacterium]
MAPFKLLKLSISPYLLALLAVILAHLTAGTSFAASAKLRQSSFSSPARAVHGLFSAVKNNNIKTLKSILGPGSGNLISSGDPVTDQAGRARFIELYNEKNQLEPQGSGRMVLTLGKDNYPFPLPLVRKGSRWVFDTKTGSREILHRRIGRNELVVMDVLQAYLEAQREYARKDHDGNGVLEFARKLNSSTGRQDGLYWEVKEGEEPSPFGPLMAKADCEGYGRQLRAATPEPYHGYYFKVLTKQGNNAEGGEFEYLVNDKMVLGFALVAYPARYRASGVMTFTVNQGGVIYQKDLGRETARIGMEMVSFDPDSSWKSTSESVTHLWGGPDCPGQIAADSEECPSVCCHQGLVASISNRLAHL